MEFNEYWSGYPDSKNKYSKKGIHGRFVGLLIAFKNKKLSRYGDIRWLYQKIKKFDRNINWRNLLYV
jgi:hypothetical protein